MTEDVFSFVRLQGHKLQKMKEVKRETETLMGKVEKRNKGEYNFQRIINFIVRSNIFSYISDAMEKD